MQINKESAWSEADYRRIRGFQPKAGYHYILRIKKLINITTNKVQWVKDRVVRQRILNK
ncbi:MAG: DUF4377 domain-containing protein [Thiotrichaceae bacterium]|nr:DUF4377 domain-containing protein [Thiotrichaceae bacterium]